MISVTRDIGLVSFSGNPVMLGVQSFNHKDEFDVPRPFYTILCEIFIEDPALEGDPVYIDSVQPDADGNAIFDLSAVLKDYTTPTLPWPVTAETQAVKDASAVVTFWLRLSDAYGTPFTQQDPYFTSDPYYAIPGGLSDAVLEDIDTGTSNCFAFITSNKIFLTSQPLLKRVYPNQTELLRFFNYIQEGSGTYALKLKQYKWDGTDETSTIWSGSLDELALYSFNVTPSHINISSTTDYWEIWLELADVAISEVVSYSRNEEAPTNPRLFIMQNSLGGFDTVIAKGNRTLTSEGETNSGFIARVSSVRRWLEPTQDRRVSISIYKGILGFFTNEELGWLKELFLSEKKYLFDNGRLETITLRQTSFPDATDEPPGQIEIEAVIGSPFMFFF